jgi:hypothetical protein
MTELDLVVAIRDTSDSASLHFMNFVSGLFAFVLASHFVGARLSRLNLGILIGIFSAFSLISGFATVARLRMVDSLLQQASALPDPTFPLPGLIVGPYAPVAVSIVIVIAYGGGVAFLIEARRLADPSRAPAA